MKFYTSILILAVAVLFSACSSATDKVGNTKNVAERKAPKKNKQKKQKAKIGPWDANQIMEPSELANKISDGSVNEIAVYSVGPSALIPNSINIGNVKTVNNQNKLREALKNVDKDEEIVVYCGCCPFKNCPNFKPAYQVLNDLGFTNFKLLNLKQNIKTDWIDKGYPTN